MSKIRVLSDHVANQIAAGEVVERPASVAKELVENSIDAGARNISVDVEAGGRRLLRVADDGEGMTRDDALLAFERHATSKIGALEDLERIRTLGFRGEALASIASVARVELITQIEGEAEGTRVLIEGGRMRDVSPTARPRGTTITVRDLFFNVPARRKFLRSEATESYHLTNFVTHYALAHPEIAFVLTNNGREILRSAPAANLRERAYQIFGADFIENLLEVGGGHESVASVRGYVSAPRERRTSRDAQYLFVNGRFVRDRLIARALTEGFRTVLPQGVYPAALLFLDVPTEEVDVNVHPAKTEVRFRRAAAVADAVRDAVRGSLASSGFLRLQEDVDEQVAETGGAFDTGMPSPETSPGRDSSRQSVETREQGEPRPFSQPAQGATRVEAEVGAARSEMEQLRQEVIEFIWSPTEEATPESGSQGEAPREMTTNQHAASSTDSSPAPASQAGRQVAAFPPVGSAAGIVRSVAVESLSPHILPLGQLEDSFIIATDPDGLLLIDQHAAHERILFDKYHELEAARRAESQNLLIPETFDLTPAQAAAFDIVAEELETYGFGLMRLSGRTIAVRAVPADLPAGEARNMLAEVLDACDAEKRGAARASLHEQIAVSLSCRAAVKLNTPLSAEKMRWLIERLLNTSSPTTCPHGRPTILRLTRRDIERGFHRR
ncbi:MAG: DNA mismatch repair endonuclease MutL [Acidobacteria bacterium]|nr:DNA mismatch repair endonuclease MutL [Acidobacteriota bacterium]